MGAGTIADITEPAKRAFAMSIFLMGPQLGPVLGPVLGGALAGAASWRWIFGFLAILAFCIWLLILFALPETLRYRVGNGRIYQGKSFLIFPPTLSSKTVPDEQRGPKPPKPTAKMFWNLFLYPPIGIVSFNSSLLFAGFYSIATSQPSILGERYHWSTVEVGLAYLAPGLAMVSGSLIGGRFSDWHRAHLLRKTENGTVEPETRLMNQIWGVLVAASGTLIYGWTTQYRVHPAVVLIATSLAGGGMSWVFVTSTSYCTEVVPAQAAAVVALGNMLRNPAAAVAAAIIEPLTNSMGLGWCFTGLALLELIVVGGLVILLRIRSPYWRRQRVARLAAAKRPGLSQPPK
ncbi:hypothetical protein FH972_023039 [Carpinus fangiana]|uniref:Major facilitator superfamily (MFS) profile domain-containing protein n=1 Tax=Carpinus fangiana TaxID=176857 RepID=A0A5N6KUG8_9ROSI|nr:hypothetical protein FH972_023039 [Carpinus fangiana]